MANDLATYISTYRSECIRKGNGIPVEAGAAGGTGFVYPTRDDTGDNISELNEYYGDLTVLYWVWKNGIPENDPEFVSFRHYNKYLYISEKAAVKYLRSHENGWIVAKAGPNPAHNFKEEWEVFRDIIKDKYPFYYPELVKTYDESDGSGNKCNSANMFITSAEQMDEYCDILFKICKDLRDAIGATKHSRSDQRYCAFMAERFLTVFINAHGFPKSEVDVCRSRWPVQKLVILARKLGITDRPVVKKIGSLLLKDGYRSSFSGK